MPGNLVNVSSAPNCFNERCRWSAAWRAHAHTHFPSTINTIAHFQHMQTVSVVKMNWGWVSPVKDLPLPFFFFSCIFSQDLIEFSGATNPPNRRPLDLLIASTAYRWVCVLMCAHPIGFNPYLPHYFSDGENTPDVRLLWPGRQWLISTVH